MSARILVVDDQADVVFFCQRVLEHLGYQVSAANSGHEALECLRREHHDVLVTDVMMPGMMGTELMVRAREMQPHLATIVITGFSDIETAIKCLRAGAQDFVTKPFSIDDLRAAVEHALSQARLSQEAAKVHVLWPLFELSKHSLSQVDVSEWRNRVIDIAMAQTGATCAALVLTSDDQDGAHLALTRGKLPTPWPQPDTLLQALQGVPAATMLSPAELPGMPTEALAECEISTVLCVPLHAPSGFVGALLLAKKARALPFGESDIEIASILGSQLAALLENVRLIRALESWNRELEARIAERTRELELAQERLLRAERLATVGKLGSSIAHELRNPLAVINNSAYYLNKRLGDSDPKIAKHLEIIAREVQTSNGIITDLMNFVRVHELKTVPVEPNALIEHTLTRAAIPETVQVTCELAEQLPAVAVDADKMEQVFLNLINNAVQAMPEGGKLEISTGQENGHVLFGFTDSGCGIPPENLERIFEPLFTTKTKGIGLGLSIVKLLIEAHHGEIDVHSRVGAGTSFVVRLPHQNTSEKEVAA